MKDNNRQPPFPADDDVERAWQAFANRMRHEKAPAIWSQLNTAPQQAASEQPHAVPKDNPTNTRIEEEHEMRNETNETVSFMPDQAAMAARKPARWSRLRGWAVGAAAVALTVGMLSTSWGDQAFAAMLQTFRLQHMQGVSVTENDLQHIEDALRKGAVDGQTLNLDRFGTLRQEGGGEPKEMSPAEAEALLGFPVRLKADNSQEQSKVLVIPATTLTLKLNVEEVNRVIERLGGTSLLPKSADGQDVTFRIPAAASMELAVGDRGFAEFGKAEAPSFEVGAGIDADAVRNAVLDLPVLPKEMRNKLKSISDWKHTLPIPNMEGLIRNLSLSGRDAVVSENDHSRLLMWIDGGRISILSGSKSVFPNEEDILSKGKELLNP